MVTIMRDATVRAYPRPYSEVCDTLRPRIWKVSAIRADLGRKLLVNFRVPSSVRNRFIAEHISKGRPTRVENGLCHFCFGKTGGVHVAHGDIVKRFYDAGGNFMMEIKTRISDLCVKIRNLAFLIRSLHPFELRFKIPKPSWITDLLPGGKTGELFQPEVDADAPYRLPGFRVRNLDGDVEIPSSPGVAREGRPVFDLPLWQKAGHEDTERNARETKGVRSIAPDAILANRNPSKGFSSAITKKRPLLLTSRLFVLKADKLNRRGIQPKLFAGTRREFGKIVPARPFTAILKRLLLCIVAEVPNEVDGTSPSIKKTGLRLDAISECFYHLFFSCFIPVRAFAFRTDHDGFFSWNPRMVTSKAFQFSLHRDKYILENNRSQEEHALYLRPEGRRLTALFR